MEMYVFLAATEEHGGRATKTFDKKMLAKIDNFLLGPFSWGKLAYRLVPWIHL